MLIPFVIVVETVLAFFLGYASGRAAQRRRIAAIVAEVQYLQEVLVGLSVQHTRLTSSGRRHAPVTHPEIRH